MYKILKTLITGDVSAIRGDKLVNYDNLVYIGKMYMGSNMEPLDVNFDTGSYHFLAEVHTCPNCPGNVYDYRDELGGSFRFGVGSYTEEFLDGTKLRGDYVYDTVCISSNPYTCAADFQWLAISNNKGLSDYEDGILGMWSGANDPDNQPGLLVPWLYKKGVIREPTFSFLLDGMAGMSYLDFGKPDINVMSNKNDLIYLDVEENSEWWMNYVTGFKWGVDDSTSFKLDKAKAITDTGQSCLSGPAKVVDHIGNTLISLLETVDADNIEEAWFKCKERTNLPSFYLLYGDYWFEVR